MTAGSAQSGVGRIIDGRYLLLKQVGSGGMGHVWLAHDQRLDCDVALKEIRFRDVREGSEEHESRIARARAEARHAAVLRGHPHVVTVHDVLEHDGLPWIVMEYVAGAEDLRAWLARRGPLAPDECARVGLAVLDALTAGHERGIMHRDVKPANILLAPDRAGTPGARILLTDYGVSVQPDSPETRWTRTSVLVGTAGYLAPERAQGGQPTAASDLFSLGCTLYFGVEGHGPFDRDSHLGALAAVVAEEAPPSRRAGALGPIIDALLVKDPALRISAERTAAALARIILPEPHPPTQVDIGSQPAWAGLVTSDGPGGPAPPGRPPGGLSRDHDYAPPAHDQSPSPARGQGLAPPARDPGPAAPGREQSSVGQDRDQGFAAPGSYVPTAQASTAPAHHAAYSPMAQAAGNRAGAPAAYAPRPGQGFGPPTPHPPRPGAGFGPPGYMGPAAPAPDPGGRRGKRTLLLQVGAALLLALSLTAGVLWGMARYGRTQTPVAPYGAQVGLSAPLKKGDCVLSDPSPAPSSGTPRLQLDPSCGALRPDGQVMELYKARSFEEADSDGADRCAERTKATADKLAWHVQSLAVVPTREGFDATGGNVACLLVGKHGPVYGRLGGLRPYGMVFEDATQMQQGDCLGHARGDASEYTHYELVSCDKDHVGQVFRITHLTTLTPKKEADEQANARCMADAPPQQLGYPADTYVSHGLRSTGLWRKGYYLVVCSIERLDKALMHGGE
ncbi:protein kinase [Streptomyces sp. NPDC059697]|uniref:serine/threonine-protein kinase n=1 Tax=Streptomyces sp. NPDC059697 TaxID=3346912 RepID=UPI00367D811C